MLYYNYFSTEIFMLNNFNKADGYWLFQTLFKRFPLCRWKKMYRILVISLLIITFSAEARRLVEYNPYLRSLSKCINPSTLLGT